MPTPRDLLTNVYRAFNGRDTNATGRTLVTVHQVVRDLAGHVVADPMVQHIYRFEDGLIKHMEIDKP
jgi:hypothetical protein